VIAAGHDELDKEMMVIDHGQESGKRNTLRIATWNLNNRVGKVTFRPEAAHAAITLDADVLALTEYFPQTHDSTFRGVLHAAGWIHQMISVDTGDKANRILVASRIPMEPLALVLPDFDRQFPANILGVRLPDAGVSVLGIRIPWYEREEAALTVRAWDWLASAAGGLVAAPGILLGDLNVGLKSGPQRGGKHFRGLLQSGWHRAEPAGGASYTSTRGATSEIDHVLATNHCNFKDARYVATKDGYTFAGTDGAISDHAALVVDVTVSQAG
jgi:endonuclease/exonuclease/phosphatase family metal-dependent hydrolase